MLVKLAEGQTTLQAQVKDTQTLLLAMQGLVAKQFQVRDGVAACGPSTRRGQGGAASLAATAHPRGSNGLEAKNCIPLCCSCTDAQVTVDAIKQIKQQLR